MNKGVLIVVIGILVAGAVGVYMLGDRGAEEPQIPVENDMPEPRTVTLYYYNSEKDRDMEGNILCSRQGLEGVEREIRSNTPIEETIRLLLSGNLTQEERENGISTEFPLAGVSLVDTALENGTLTLRLQDGQNKTVGGSCRVAVLWFQVQATAQQFPEVSIVRFEPEDLFQP